MTNMHSFRLENVCDRMHLTLSIVYFAKSRKLLSLCGSTFLRFVDVSNEWQMTEWEVNEYVMKDH